MLCADFHPSKSATFRRYNDPQASVPGQLVSNRRRIVAWSTLGSVVTLAVLCACLIADEQRKIRSAAATVISKPLESRRNQCGVRGTSRPGCPTMLRDASCCPAVHRLSIRNHSRRHLPRGKRWLAVQRQPWRCRFQPPFQESRFHDRDRSPDMAQRRPAALAGRQIHPRQRRRLRTTHRTRQAACDGGGWLLRLEHCPVEQGQQHDARRAWSRSRAWSTVVHLGLDVLASG